MKYLYQIIDLLFYGNFWIAACAAAMLLQTQLLLTGKMTLDPLAGLVFFATLFLYAIHRTVGLQKVEKFTEKGRYFVIARFKKHIQFYAISGAVGAVVCFFFVSWHVQLALIIPGIISLGYVLPFLSGKRRLRDLDHIKIYLIAIVWAWITVVLPAIEFGFLINSEHYKPLVIMTLERTLFIFAITIPFDIRDLKIDAHTGVKTIPAQVGIGRTKAIAISLLFVMNMLVLINYFDGFYSIGTQSALLISFISTLLIILFSDKIEHDYYFTGGVDGMMLWQFVLVLICT